ncbi:hypothetical protein LPJ53_002928 [Coemansia erecta]|uniref:RGS domain-containing protein n=1 Tax=Coemansia erecta TaxID=147472 RepID=A0A9W7Y373_9FUNG|nr:hypothetical protein LPJ53_002928 [Coemansia erecta]
MSVYIIYLFYITITAIMFVRKAKDKHSGLAQRNTKLVMLQVLSGCLMGTVGMISTAFQKWPAFLRLWFTNVGYLVMFAAVIARGFQYIVVSNLHNITSDIANSKNPRMMSMQSQTSPEFARQSSRFQRSGSQSSAFSNTDYDTPSDTVGKSEKVTFSDLARQARDSSLHAISGPERRLHKRLQKYAKLQHLASSKSMFLFVMCNFLVAIVISLVVNILNDQFTLSPMSMLCRLVWGFIPVMVVGGIYVIFVMPIIFVKCWKLKDAYGIRNDLLICIIMGIFCIIMNTVWDVVLQSIAVIWSGWFFSWITGVVIHTVSVTVPLFAAIRHSRDVTDRMHGASGIETSMVAAIAGANGNEVGKRSEYNAILADPHEYRYFRDFAASCFCSEMTAFIDEYQMLKELTVLSLGSEDVWRQDINHAEAAYSMQLATNTIDNGVSYLAMSNRSAHPNTRALRLQTPPTVTIIETAKAVYPQYDFNENTPFPVASMDKLIAIFSVFINSNSYTAVTLPPSMIIRLRERLGTNQLTLTILDEIKEEVLNMLYFDVYTRYSKRK